MVSSNVINKAEAKGWSANKTAAVTIVAGGLSGGISSTIAGGNFWAGVRQGLITSGLNHIAHDVLSKPDNGYKPDGKGGYEQVNTDGGDVIDYLYSEDGTLLDVTTVYRMEYETHRTDATCTRTYGYQGVPVHKEYSSVPQGGHALIDPTGDIVYGYAGGGLALRGLGIAWKGFVRYTGFPKQWFRFGPSYSHTLGEKTYLSLRLGAGANHWKKIASPTLQSWNKSFRTTKRLINSWRAADPGHFHIFPKSPFKF